jgi:RNA polymerase sigma-70 factor, ECF subfamily
MALRGGATHADAFDALFAVHHDYVYSLAQALLENTQDAEDVTQEVFLRAYRALPFYQPERATLRTWLTTMVVNACKTHKRRNFLRNLLSRGRGRDRNNGYHGVNQYNGSSGTLDDEQVLNTADASLWGSPEEHAVQSELRASVKDVLGELRIEHRTVVILHYYQNLSCQEIAQIVGCPEGTVRSRLHYARRIVKVRLEKRTISSVKGEEL